MLLYLVSVEHDLVDDYALIIAECCNCFEAHFMAVCDAMNKWELGELKALFQGIPGIPPNVQFEIVSPQLAT